MRHQPFWRLCPSTRYIYYSVIERANWQDCLGRAHKYWAAFVYSNRHFRKVAAYALSENGLLR